MPKMPNMPKMPKIPGASGGDASLPPLEYRRLAALGAGILVVVMVLVLLARGCSGLIGEERERDLRRAA